MIDSHAHLAEEAYDIDRVEVLTRAAEAGIDTVIVVGYDAPSCRRVVDVVREFNGHGVELFATAGVAPHHVLETGEDDLDAVRDILAAEVVVAVGEIGLDYHYDMPPERQRELFARQLEWAVDRLLPVVVHSREAEADVLAGLRDHGCSRGVIHCFTEGPAMALNAVELGFYISFAGILTFKNAQGLRDIAATVPLDRILIETDSPFLAPVPYRGRRNEPAFVVEVARVLADLHGTSVEEVERITSRNVRQLFSLPTR